MLCPVHDLSLFKPFPTHLLKESTDIGMEKWKKSGSATGDTALNCTWQALPSHKKTSIALKNLVWIVAIVQAGPPLEPFFVTTRYYHLAFFLVERPCGMMDFYSILVSLQHLPGAGN